MSPRIISSLLALSVAAGCATNPQDLAFEDSAAPELGKADHRGLELTPIDAFIGDRRFDGGLQILTSAERYSEYLGVEAPADIDFDREWVVFFGLGVRNTGGFAAVIDGLEYYPSFGALVVNTREVQPGFDCIVTQALTNPYVLFKFDIPEDAAWYTSRHEVERRRCGPSPEELQADLAESRSAWDATVAANGASYTYVSEFHSFLGFSSQTTIVVEDNVVVERHFKAQHTGGGDATTWSEIGGEVGSHPEGAPALLVDDLYDQCADEVLIQDFDDNFIHLSFDDAGLLQACQFTPRLCQDDCSRGPSISSIELQ